MLHKHSSTYLFLSLALALLLVLVLVQPSLAADIVVTTVNDVLDAAGYCNEVTIASLPGPDGVTSLREAMCAANNNAGPDTINFNIAGCSGVCTVQPAFALPTLSSDSTTIDGYTQPGASPATATVSATLKIEIDGTNAGYSNGFHITGANNVIKGLVINRFSFEGVYIIGAGATGNTIAGNYIGVDASGTTGQGNTLNGVHISDSAQNNTVGGDTAGARNVISGNDVYGVVIDDISTTGNTIAGNYIGLDASGTLGLGNAGNGIAIGNGAQNNTVGGNTANKQNVISGNGGAGLTISGEGNTIAGNYIGTDASGALDLGNAGDGVYISGRQNTVGGDTAGERNVISGNDECGVRLYGTATISNTISGNYIGTDASGTADVGNGWDGVAIQLGPQNNTIGGDTAGERNVISGNDLSGVVIYGSNTMSNTVSGNYIGTDAIGVADRGNAYYGVYIGSSPQNNIIGPDNVIAHNGVDGVEVDGSSTSGNIITQNSIFANIMMGIDLWGGANGNIAAPDIITTSGSINVVGVACPGCTVEVFRNSDTDGEGETYVGKTTATAGGAFTVTVSSLSDPYLTATATDAISGTSEFSAVFTATVTGRDNVYLPVIVKND